MSGEQVYIVSPVMRFVQGDAFTGSDKDFSTGRQRVDKKGNVRTTWFMGCALPKNDPAWPELWNQVVAVAQRDFPALMPNIFAAWQAAQSTGHAPALPDGFAWKIGDGDEILPNGQPRFPNRPEINGHWIFRFSNGYAPQIFNAENPPQQIVDPSQCKRGYYVRVNFGLIGNDDAAKPGVYMNHSMVQVVAYGEEIVSGPSAAEVFGTPVAALPPGASATPLAPAAPMPAATGTPPMAPAPVAAPPAAAPAPTPPMAPATPTAPAPPMAPAAPYPAILDPANPTAPAPVAPASAPGVAAPPANSTVSPTDPGTVPPAPVPGAPVG